MSISDFFSSQHLLLTAAVLLLAFGLDNLLGETRRFHPLIGFGNLVYKI